MRAHLASRGPESARSSTGRRSNASYISCRSQSVSMTLATSMSGPYKQNLKWIDSNDPNVRREVRIHAQRESHRAKRQRQREEYEQVRASTTRLFGLSREPASSATPAVSSSGEISPSGEPASSSTGYPLGSTVQTFPWTSTEQPAVTGAVVDPLSAGFDLGGRGWGQPGLVAPAQGSPAASFTNPTFPQLQSTTSRRDLLRAVPVELDEDGRALVNHCTSSPPHRYTANILRSQRRPSLALWRATLICCARDHISFSLFCTSTVPSYDPAFLSRPAGTIRRP